MILRHASLFSRLLSVVNRQDFARLVKETQAEKGAKGFTCWEQFVAMMFCQLAQAKSLREIGSGLRSCEGKLRHLGLEEAPRHSTLSYANAHRPWELFEKVFHEVLRAVQVHAPGKKLRFKNKLYSLDSTVIDLCAEVFEWAKFRTTKGAVKLHLLLDHDGYLPHYALLTEGKVADVTVAQQLVLPKGSLVVMDRGYNDYRMFERWSAHDVGFVTRLKVNADCLVTAERPVPQNRNVSADETIEFNVFQAGRQIKGSYRRVKVWLEDKQEELVLLTNRHDLGATTIAGHLQGALANRAVLQSHQAEPQDQDLRGHQRQRGAHPDLDSIDGHRAAQAPAVPLVPGLGIVESGGPAALESLHLPRSVGVDRQSLCTSAPSAGYRPITAEFGQHARIIARTTPQPEQQKEPSEHPAPREIKPAAQMRARFGQQWPRTHQAPSFRVPLDRGCLFEAGLGG